MSGGELRQTHQLRHTITAAVLAFYTVPLALITLYTTSVLPFFQAWQILSIGLLSASIGTASLLTLLRRWEQARTIVVKETVVKRSEPAPARAESGDSDAIAQELQELQQKHDALAHDLHQGQKALEVAQREKEQAILRCEELQDQQRENDRTNQDELQNKATLLEEYQQTISDQRAVIEKKQKRVEELENRIKDLKYELKTVLDVNERIERGEEPPVSTSNKPQKAKKAAASADEPTLDLGFASPSQSLDEAQAQLKRCIDIAQKLTGARHLAGDSSTFRDLSAAGYALDLRRLCDSLRSEQSSMIVLYSQRENKLLFVNNQVRGLLGWSPEKFVQHYHNLIVQGEREWRAALGRLSSQDRSTLSFTLKARTGEERPVRCLLGTIPTGIFKSHVVGVFFPQG